MTINQFPDKQFYFLAKSIFRFTLSLNIAQTIKFYILDINYFNNTKGNFRFVKVYVPTDLPC